MILVADHTKFNAKSFYRLDFDFIDILITNRELPIEIREVLDQKNITVIECQDEAEEVRNQE